jgi:hypothetical protein
METDGCGCVLVQCCEAELCADEADRSERRSSLLRNECEAKKSDGDGEPSVPTASIALRAWDPAMPYLTKIKGAKDPYAEYVHSRGNGVREKH